MTTSVRRLKPIVARRLQDMFHQSRHKEPLYYLGDSVKVRYGTIVAENAAIKSLFLQQRRNRRMRVAAGKLALEERQCG